MAGGMIFAVGDFALNQDLFQKKILLEHPTHIGVDLADRIDILFHAILARTPLTKDAACSPLYFFAISTASLMAMAGSIFSYRIS